MIFSRLLPVVSSSFLTADSGFHRHAIHRSIKQSKAKQLLATATVLLLLTLIAGVSSVYAANTINVPAGGDLQAAINAAQSGDTLLLEAGATFRGTIYLPQKQGSQYITIRTSTPDSQLPAPGQRITPAFANLLPKIVSVGMGDAAMETQARAHHYRFIGIEVMPADAQAVVFDLIRFGDGGNGQYRLEDVPHDLVIDRCYIHGDANGTLKRGVALNSAATQIINSYFSECKAVGQDTQTIAGWNGPGPFLIENNYLEASGYPVIFGGSYGSIPGVIPSDITVRRNTLTRPLGWRGVYLVKNLFELKNARRVVVEGNLLENNWSHGQEGFAVQLTTRDEGGTMPWAVVEDVTITNNIFRHTGGGFNLYGSEGSGMRRIRIANNLLDDVNGGQWGGRGILVQATAISELSFDHNTALQDGHTAYLYGQATANLQFTNNLTAHNQYGIFGDGVGNGNAALAAYAPNATVRGNVIAGAAARNYPSDNYYPASLDSALFVDRAAGNYRLQPQSPFRLAATDGKDIGCDFDQLAAALGGLVTTPTPSPSPTPTPTTSPSPSPSPSPAVSDGEYFIVSRSSGKVLAQPGGVQDNGAKVAQWTLNRAVNQRWAIQSIGNGEYKITAKHSGKSLDVPGASRVDGTGIIQWNYTGAANQRWRIAPAGSDGYFRVVSVNSGKALDVSGGSTEDDASILQWTIHSGNNQQWQLTKATPFVISVKAVNGAGLTTDKGGSIRSNMYRRVTFNKLGSVGSTIKISVNGVSLAAPNTDPNNDLRLPEGTIANLAESVTVEARTSDGRRWTLPIEFAGIDRTRTDSDEVRTALPTDFPRSGRIELTIMVGDVRSNTVFVNFR